MDNLTVTSASSPSARTGDQRTKIGAEVSSETSVQVFPNPAATSFFVGYTAQEPDMIRISITDLMSRTVQEKTVMIKPGKVKLEIDTRTLGVGTYLVRITQGNQTVARKLIVER